MISVSLVYHRVVRCRQPKPVTWRGFWQRNPRRLDQSCSEHQNIRKRLSGLIFKYLQFTSISLLHQSCCHVTPVQAKSQELRQKAANMLVQACESSHGFDPSNDYVMNVTILSCCLRSLNFNTRTSSCNFGHERGKHTWSYLIVPVEWRSFAGNCKGNKICAIAGNHWQPLELRAVKHSRAHILFHRVWNWNPIDPCLNSHTHIDPKES